MAYYIDYAVEKQICVNRLLNIPDDLIDIIKSYTFTDIVIYMAKMRKKTIHTLIVCTGWAYRNKKYDRYMFWIQEDPRCRQFHMSFCEKCGDYTTNHSHDQCEKIYCKCF
jgi:hypothetical protein